MSINYITITRKNFQKKLYLNISIYLFRKNQLNYFITDLHGSKKGLEETLIKCNFDFKNDKIIFGGDICDYYPDTFELIELLMTIENVILIRGNHDTPFMTWLKKDYISKYWSKMDCQSTLNSYDNISIHKKIEHYNFLKKSKKYHIENDKLFVHSGFNLNRPLNKQSYNDLNKNRSFWTKVLNSKNKKFKPIDMPFINEVFIGHTPVNKNNKSLPIKKSNVWNVDTGCGNGGKATLINIDNKEFYQSDFCYKLYKNIFI